MNWRRIIAITLAAIVLGSLAIATVQTWRLRAAQRREEQARVAQTRAELVAAGFQRAAESNRPETATPSLAPVAATARKAGAKPVAAVRVETREVPFYLPTSCPDVPPFVAGAERPAEGREAPPVPSPVLVSAEVEGLVVADIAGGIHWAGRVFGTLKRAEWSQRKELPIAAEDVRIDPALSEAWRSWTHRPPRLAFVPRPARQWRLGWSVGPGIAYDPFRGRAAGVIAVTWGAQL